MERGNSFQSTRIEARAKLSGPERPSLDYLLEIIDSEDLNFGTEAKWIGAMKGDRGVERRP